MPTSPLVDRERFLAALSERFPEVASSITDIEAGLLHPEMSVVSHATRRAIEKQDWQVVQAHFQFLDRIFSNGNEAVRNAVYVSYLENVFLGETAEHFLAARAMLPEMLSTALTELEAHLKMLAHARRIDA